MTFLFTDIEGSTRRWEADAESMRAALVAHDKVLRTAIESHDGFLFSHTGDGVVAAFASPKAAVDAAVDAQRELQLPVRMGIATGEAELCDGDYFGIVLNRAARVMAAGHGGQILVADSAAVLLTGVDLVNLGPRRLRDVPNPITVFQLHAVGLRTDFPSLRTLDTSPGNLRPAATSLIGRDDEAAQVEASLRTHRLVTLTGVGGVGKTRLAIEVASNVVDEFPDGVWIFELAAVTDPLAVPNAVAAVLGITQQPGKSMAESVAAALVGRVRLLVIDNCEHVLDAAADLIGTILASSVTVKVLATSRQGLDVAGEHLWRVPSLDVGAAVELFVERAYSIVSDVSTNETTAVEEICRRLDGIPLAIELAASRMASMTAAEVRDRLDDRFKLLVGSRRGVEHHQTLRHAVAWSYDLLDDAERELLEVCAVFAGGFDLQSACAIAKFQDADDFLILDLLDALVRKSLLVIDRSKGRTRYAMLETIRQFAEERLADRGAAEAVRIAHARHFAQREAEVMALWDSPRQREAYEWLVTELPNLRTAFRWVADHGDLDSAAAIATYATYLGFWLEIYEPIAWAEEAIEPARLVGHPRLASLYAMASQCCMLGRITEAVRYSEAGQELIASGDSGAPDLFVAWLFTVYIPTGGNPLRTADLCRAHLQRGQDIHAVTRTTLVIALAFAGSRREAIAAADGLIDAAEGTHNPHVLAYALIAYGTAYGATDPGRAIDALRRGLEIAQHSGNRNDESHLAMTLGRIEANYGDPLAAFDYLSLAVRNHQNSGNTTMLRSSLTFVGSLLHRLGHNEAAATIAGYAFNPTVFAVWIPELSTAIPDIRSALGDQVYSSLTRQGETMTPTDIATYASEQIGLARAELERSQ